MQTEAAWFAKLRDCGPMTANTMNHHIAYYGELLSTVLFGELVRMSCSIFDNVKVGIETNTDEILALGEWVYVGYTEVDESLVEIIIAGFFEAYLQIGDRHPELTKMFGERFSGIILQWCAEHNLHFYDPDSE